VKYLLSLFFLLFAYPEPPSLFFDLAAEKQKHFEMKEMIFIFYFKHK
jgi:hypothetical protein